MRAVVPVRDGVLPAGGTEAIAECDGRVVIIGTGTADAAAGLAGITTDMITIEAAQFAPASWAAALATHLRDEPHVVLPASPDGRDLAPRLAVLLDRDLHAGAMSISPDHIELVRSGGLVVSDIRPTAPFVATLQPGVRGVDVSAAREATSPRSVRFDGSTPLPDPTVIEVMPPDAATMDLAESPRIIGGGAGLASADAFAQLTELSVRLDASMGATRVITDRGWVGHERQIGTTGVVVSPDLYLAFGISGAVQHTSGLGQPNHIISINTDPHCPMMQLADLAVVSDANAVLIELLDRLPAHD